MRFIHTADIHLGVSPDSRMPWGKKRADEIWESFYRLLDEVEAKRADLLLIAGDLFHRQPLKRELKEVNYRFSSLSDTNIVIIAGNHDPITPNSNYRDFEWAPNVAFFRKNHMSYIYLEKINTIIYGMSYDTNEIRDNIYDGVRPMKRFKDGSVIPPGTAHILLAHGGDETHIPVKMERIRRAGFDYAAFGHIHKPSLEKNAAIGYAGALEPIDRGDEGQHGYIYGEISPDHTCIEFIPFAGRSYISRDIQLTKESTMSSICDQISDQINACGTNNIYKLSFTGLKPFDLDLDMNMIETLGNIIVMDDKTIPDFDYDRLYMENRDNLIGMFIEKVRGMDISDDTKERTLYHGMKAFINVWQGDGR